MDLVNGTLSRFVWKMFFLKKGRKKKNFLFETLMVWDLQRSLEAQAFEGLPPEALRSKE